MCIVPCPVTKIPTAAAAHQYAAQSISPNPHSASFRVTQRFPASTDSVQIREKLFRILFAFRKFGHSGEVAESQGLSLQRPFLSTVCFQAALTAEVHGHPVPLMHLHLWLSLPYYLGVYQPYRHQKIHGFWNFLFILCWHCFKVGIIS